MITNYSSYNAMVTCINCGSMVIVPVIGVEVLCPRCGASVGVGA